MLASVLGRLMSGCADAEDYCGEDYCGQDYCGQDYCGEWRQQCARIADMVELGSPTSGQNFVGAPGRPWASLGVSECPGGPRGRAGRAGRHAEDFAGGGPPAGLDEATRRRIASAAGQVRREEVVRAAARIEQQAGDVCKINLGLSPRGSGR